MISKIEELTCSDTPSPAGGGRGRGDESEFSDMAERLAGSCGIHAAVIRLRRLAVSVGGGSVCAAPTARGV